MPPSGPDQQIERIEKLAALRSSGAITAEEFETMKAGIIGSNLLGGSTGLPHLTWKNHHDQECWNTSSRT
ncbi:SHOCT domain-containing protein [Agrobacterium sp. LMR679]|uniref:SHOCT domain-containing protein n=1 Tax=Agrobacterium sp. LMR679 TaxID=3014335 RepID=UPI003FA4103B